VGELGSGIDNGRLEGGGEVNLGNALRPVQLVEYLLTHGFPTGGQRISPFLKRHSNRQEAEASLHKLVISS